MNGSSQAGAGRREIHFQAPGFKRYETSEFQQSNRREFVSISLTGSSCALQCDHCQGRILASMAPVPGPGRLFDLCARLAARGTRGVLVSGGSDRQGRVPHVLYREELHRVREELGLAVLVHTGLVDEAMAEALAAAGVDGALVDVIGHDATIREVYHLDASVAAFDRSLALLEAHGVPAAPHIVMGLHHGRFLGEEVALELVAAHRAAALVLVALMPVLGTPMWGSPAVHTGECVAFARQARERLPLLPMVLGCARPAGEAKAALDRAAIDAGFDGIAFPAEGTVEYARERGLAPRFHETCCGLPWLLGRER
jgi:uncharacterized radical SAM superfamily protein